MHVCVRKRERRERERLRKLLNESFYVHINNNLNCSYVHRSVPDGKCVLSAPTSISTEGTEISLLC